MTGHGDAKNPGGEIQISGDQIKFRGLSVQRAEIEAAVQQARAVLRKCKVTLDQNNSVELSGEAALADPNPYTARGSVALHDLGTFNDVLKSFAQPGGLTGTLNAELSGDGNTKNPEAELRVHGTELKYLGVLLQSAEIEATLKDWLASIQTCRV